MKLLSVVVPCYNEQEAIPFFYQEIIKVARDMGDQVDFEFIFVNDGSADETLSIVKSLHKADKRVRFCSFSRNFGKEAAMYAGMKAAAGDYIAIMDADLQDPPQMLPGMLEAIEKEGYDSVATRRVTRKGEPPIRSFFARRFYTFINKISKTEIVDGARDFRLMTRQMADAILDLEEYNRFSKGLFSWVGFKTKWLEYENVKRVAGETKWSFWKLLLYSLDGIAAFSTVPLALASVVGVLLFFISIITILFFIFKTLIFGDPVAGYPSLVCIITCLGGIQLFCTGILGQYLAKTYLETKKRPLYIMKETELDIRDDKTEDGTGYETMVK